ncbi:hypothetical protein Pan97_33760 [Bremerella volcania]|uniref:Uncharacterized protein n=1 Tax=Bremerella volcania TaxID=2527984 RepID=A0A518CAS6_9BACT|nr:hypothetical protein Pan97_33760 [Bremerella volcania]
MLCGANRELASVMVIAKMLAVMIGSDEVRLLWIFPIYFVNVVHVDGPEMLVNKVPADIRRHRMSKYFG